MPAKTLFQATTTPTSTNAWTVLIGVATTSSTATAGSNTTLRKQQSNNLYYGDSGGPIWRPEATGLNWTASSARWLANYFALTPSISTPGVTSTSTYAYDNNGNLTSLTIGATTTTYIYDYRNRLTESKITGSASTTYAYGPGGNRISQTTASTTTLYPSKYYSLVTTSGATSTATSTEYIFGGSNLFATIDQYILNGTATGTAITRYNHTDHLGSTAVTSDEVGNLAQSFSYAPYGAVLSSMNTGTTTAARGYIGQFTDTSGLSYLNARYYNGAQGQFTTQDPVFWEIGLSRDGKNALSNPQLLNSYGYAADNPIINKDPLGRFLELSGSLVVPGRAWSTGIRFDSNGIDYFFSGGVGVGLAAGFEAMWAPNVMLSHANQASVSAQATVANGLDGRVSTDIWTYDPATKKTIPNAGPSLGLVLGAGTGASIQLEGSAPVPYFVWNKPATRSQLGSIANIPTTISSYNSFYSTQQYVVQNNTTYSRTSNGGLAPTSLPATVTAGGSTYYRNSSGLLSTRPGL